MLSIGSVRTASKANWTSRLCGDQSSGKSSVLEAISGVRFPASDLFCTRFASELTLRRAHTASITVRIQPAPHRTEEQQRFLQGFEPPEDITKPEHFAMAIDAAGSYIADLDPNAAFFEDKLIAVVREPELPPLTHVDLPGLIHASNKEQGDVDILTVKRLVESYMATPSSIILAVLAADNNFADQIMLQLAKTADPDARRTLGIVTKRDKVDTGSRSEAMGIEYTRNGNTDLGHGWHVLVNRSFETADASMQERDMHEAAFFRRPNWRSLPDSDVGVVSLRDKLSRILLQAIRKGLPTVVSDVKQRIAMCETTLKKLGQPKATEMEQRSQLITTSMELHQLVKAEVEGNYRNPFFDDQAGVRSSSRCLRSRLREILERFAEHIRTGGHGYDVVEQMDGSRRPTTTTVDFSPASIFGNGAPVSVTRSTFLEEIAKRARRNRGLELEGMCPADIVADIFRVQSAPWEQIAAFYTSMCAQVVRAFFEEALQHAASSHIAEAVLQHLAAGRLSATAARLEEKTVDRARQQGASSEGSSSQSGRTGVDVVQAVDNDTTPATIFNYMMAYYEIALNTFTENVANLAVENCLVEGLLDLFTPVTVATMDVATMDAATVRELTLEPPTVLRERDINQKRFQTLKEILQVCNKHGDRFSRNTAREHGAASATPNLDRTDDQHAFPNIEMHIAQHTAPQSQFPASKEMPLGHVPVADPAYQTPPKTPEPFLFVSGSGRSSSARSSHRRTASGTPRSTASSSEKRGSMEAPSTKFLNRGRLSPSPAQRYSQPAVEDPSDPLEKL
ncbi:hypothetical protein LTR85_009291 [Meristemomyces frigidus]|nr:hypothetical protein LTR85_009291 [Meristemomyces frigidus]